MISVFLGYALDLLIGDPHNMPHPIRLIGNSITRVEKRLRKNCNSPKDEYIAGLLIWIIIVFSSLVIPFAISYIALKINYILYIVVESIMIYYILATKCLKDESMLVYKQLKKHDIKEARRYVSYIVGRDTENLDEKQIVKATVETIAENTSDGVIAPLIYVLIGGAPLGFMYKAINTLDSMIAYKNEKYINFGRFSAKADDVANYLPARISAYLMIFASIILNMDYKNAYKIYQRDKNKHESPNSAHTESVCAGALDVKLAGGSYYGGVFENKPTIGDDLRPIETDDIKRANKLMYATSILCLILGSLIKFLLCYFIIN